MILEHVCHIFYGVCNISIYELFGIFSWTYLITGVSFSENGEFLMSVTMEPILTQIATLASPVFLVSSPACLYFSYLLESLYVSLELTMASSDSTLASFSSFQHPTEGWTRTAVSLPNGNYSVWFTATGATVSAGLKDVRLQPGDCDYSGNHQSQVWNRHVIMIYFDS